MGVCVEAELFPGFPVCMLSAILLRLGKFIVSDPNLNSSLSVILSERTPAQTKITQCQEPNEKDDLSIIYGVFFDPSFSPVPFTLSVTMSCRPAFHIFLKFTLPPSLPCLPNSPALTTSCQNITINS